MSEFEQEVTKALQQWLQSSPNPLGGQPWGPDAALIAKGLAPYVVAAIEAALWGRRPIHATKDELRARFQPQLVDALAALQRLTLEES